MVRPMLTDLNPDELHYYPFIISQDRFDGSCNTVEDSFCQIHVPNKIGDLSLKVFTMIKGKNKSKTLVKHISCKWKCGLEVEDVIQKKNEVMISVSIQVQKIIKHDVCEEDYMWNRSICACECDKDSGINEYLKQCTCMRNLVVTWKEIVDTSVTTSINSINKINNWLLCVVLLAILETSLFSITKTWVSDRLFSR